jgi:deferrochelatase/peroxidase EfeB
MDVPRDDHHGPAAGGTGGADSSQEGSRSRLSRRQLLSAIGAGGAAVGLGGGAYAVGYEVGKPPPPRTPLAQEAIPFYGVHQAGIITPVQDRLQFAAFDVTTDKRGDLLNLLRVWTRAAARMCNGDPAVPAVPGELVAMAPPRDTGEAVGLPPSRLTITFGFGPSLFGRRGSGDRFGIAAQLPPELEEIPPLPGDELDPAISGGDIGVQACADDPQVAFHAIRNLARIGRGTVVPRWSQVGFGRTSSTSLSQETPRNLMGFKDGTNNLKAEDTDLLAEHVWVPTDTAQTWMHGGSYMVVRRIRILTEVWERTTLREQEDTVGRLRASGAPLGGKDEFDILDFAAKGPDGQPLIPADSHVRLAAPDINGGAQLLRRGYSFAGSLDRQGQLDVGLFFICFQRDPRLQFVAIQRRLGAHDKLNEYIKHTGSAVFACPAGIRQGSYVGEPLFG